MFLLSIDNKQKKDSLLANCILGNIEVNIDEALKKLNLLDEFQKQKFQVKWNKVKKNNFNPTF